MDLEGKRGEGGDVLSVAYIIIDRLFHHKFGSLSVHMPVDSGGGKLKAEIMKK